jgi:hypothetical protein
MAFLVLLTGNATGFLEMECTSWIFFPMTTSITRPWFMMVLCGGTMAALRLATGVLFRGIFPRLASCHNQRRQRQWVDFRESTVLLW